MKSKLIKPVPPIRVTGELMGRTHVQVDVSELVDEINKRIEDINRLIKMTNKEKLKEEFEEFIEKLFDKLIDPENNKHQAGFATSRWQARTDIWNWIDQELSKAVAEREKEIRQAIIDEVKGAGELWFPYEDVGDTTKGEALESAELFADDILDSIKDGKDK